MSTQDIQNHRDDFIPPQQTTKDKIFNTVTDFNKNTLRKQLFVLGKMLSSIVAFITSLILLIREFSFDRMAIVLITSFGVIVAIDDCFRLAEEGEVKYWNSEQSMCD
jgi:hypothetical protein